MYDLVAGVGEAGIAFGEHALHANEERALDLELLARVRHTVSRRRHVEQLVELVVVARMHVLVDAVAGELDLREAEVHRGRLRYVHDLAVLVDDEQKAVERLQQVRLDLALDWRMPARVHAPCFAQTLFFCKQMDNFSCRERLCTNRPDERRSQNDDKK